MHEDDTLDKREDMKFSDLPYAQQLKVKKIVELLDRAARVANTTDGTLLPSMGELAETLTDIAAGWDAYISEDELN